MIKRLVFDLDDTLIRSDHIFSEFIDFSGRDENLEQLLSSLAGRPYHEITKAITDQMDEKFSIEFMDSYLHWYDTIGWKLHDPFVGIDTLLNSTQTWSESDILIVTNKRCFAARRVLAFFFPHIRFDVRGVSEAREVDKNYHLSGLYKYFGGGADLVYVGDTLGDRDDARKSGLDFAAACWKRTPAEFSSNTKCFLTPTELLEWSLN